MISAKSLLKRLRYGGRIVSTNDLSTHEINDAHVDDRMWVDEHGFGYAYVAKTDETEISDTLFPINLCDPELLISGRYRFTCANKADGRTTYPCTGGMHPHGGGYIPCTCQCHKQSKIH